VATGNPRFFGVAIQARRFKICIRKVLGSNLGFEIRYLEYEALLFHLIGPGRFHSALHVWLTTAGSFLFAIHWSS
jgi:hypothetical protein